ncbi:MAG: DNRLRE domain-containing protein [Armatimonadetes bacterium]|nr:DNRLRE domain-containing protein [Armatimonadota bacterium]
MRKFCAQRSVLLVAIVLLVFMASMAYANTVVVRFFADGRLVTVNRAVSDGVPSAEAAVRALVAGPFVEEVAVGLYSQIPAGTKVKKLSIAGSVAEIDLSSEVLTGLDEVLIKDIFDQFSSTLGDFPSVASIKLTCNGKLLSSYLSSAPSIGEAAAPLIKGNAVGLSGKKICVGASHGRFWNGSGWYWQRGDSCGFGEAVLEDTNSVRLVQYLKQYITQDSGTFYSVRELTESNCCHSATGLAWWKMCSQSWLRNIGVPCSVWGSYTGNCGADTAAARGNDDIRCRPLYADYVGSNIYIAMHTNAGGGTGTETFRDTAMEKPAHVANSLTLANAVNNGMVNTIRNTFPGESGWVNRGVKDGQGNYGEIRIPNRPAILVELAFHDHCTRDAVYLKNEFFRSLTMWGAYSGICSYFGNTPTWGKYSCEYVSDTIPTTMNPGQTYNATITYRNRGVVWMSAYNFKVGAVSANDPLMTTRLYPVSGTIKPGSNATFTITLKAPATGGAYTTQWQMIREGYEWFGPKVTKNVTVVDINDNEPPTVPTNLKRSSATKTSISLSWTASTDNNAVAGYRIYRNGAQVGTSATNSYTDSGLAANTGYTYQVDAYDAKPNYSAKSAAFETGTGGTWTAEASMSCYTRSGTPDVCGYGGIAVGYSSTATLLSRRGLAQWDMDGAPTQAEALNTSNSVRVKLNQYTQYSATKEASISLYKVNNDWNQSNGTWNNVGIGAKYSGATVTCVDVADRTWQWNGNTQGVPPANRGVYIKNDSSESDANFAKVFESAYNSGATGKVPRLEIDYIDLTAPKNCSIKINGGATHTKSATVTLTLAATDPLSGMSQMQFSTNGTSYSTAEAYATSKSYTLPSGDGSKTVYVKFKDKVGNWSAAVSSSIILDTVAPTISISNPSESSTNVGPVAYTVTYAGASEITLANSNITLNKTDSANAGSIAVSGTGLTSRIVTLSEITGNGTLGISIASGTAKDEAGNLCAAAGPSVVFDVFSHIDSYGMSNKAAWDAIMSNAAAGKAFTLWGKVTAPIDANSFFVDDGSGMPIKINFANHGFSASDYVSATGALDVSGSAPVMNALTIKKQN